MAEEIIDLTEEMRISAEYRDFNQFVVETDEASEQDLQSQEDFEELFCALYRN